MSQSQRASTQDAAASLDASYKPHVVSTQTQYGLPKDREDALKLAADSTTANISKQFNTNHPVKFEDQPAVAMGEQTSLDRLHIREIEADTILKEDEIEARTRLQEEIWKHEQARLAAERELNIPAEQQKNLNRGRVQEFIDTVQSFANDGEIPSTQKVTSALDVAQSSSVWSEVADKPLSETGKKVAEKAEKLLGSTKRVLEEKNNNDQFQTMLKHGAIAAEEAQERSSMYESISSTFGEDKSINIQAENMTQKAVNAVKMLISSSAFRTLMRDFSGIINASVAKYGPEGATDDKPASEKFESAAQTATDVGKAKIQEWESGKPATEVAKDAASEVADKADEVKENVKDVVKNFKLPEEQREDIIQRFRALMQELQKNDQFQGAVSDLVDVMTAFYHKTSTVVAAVDAEVVEPVSNSKHADIAVQNAKELLENFSNGAPLDPFIHAVEDLIHNIKNNDKVSEYLDDLKVFFLQALRSPTFVASTDMSSQTSKLLDTGRELVSSEVYDDLHRVAQEGDKFLDHLTNDSTTNQFGQDFKELMSELLLDENGKPTFKPELVNDFAKIIPVVMDKLQYFPIPRFDSDESYDFIFDNLTFSCLVAPRHVQVLTNTHFDTVSENVVNTITFRISRVQASANNIVFYYNKKVFPRMSDVGLADFTIGGDGIDIDMTIQPEVAEIMHDIKHKELPQTRVFKVLNVESTVHDLNMTLKRTHHSWMYKMLNPFVHTMVRKQIQEAINKGLKELIFKVEDAVNQMASKVDPNALDLSAIVNTLTTGGKEE
ncbi:hypothetical protein RI367_001703 [Sorochytrium milnesiophthora]